MTQNIVENHKIIKDKNYKKKYKIHSWAHNNILIKKDKIK